ncbi:efflux RND transporter periplasmic adaptor subunit [uncultured Pseudoteredinibacter sp.]|uniref:efflux RND transporter periplasmic adaptor subunit n=1 Tax=uncultured Pseudoteredinibacter sp. TaxID=1641701 RepID=UPI00260A4667|nr:efflux RND transporter periplasmic adaptor subunit [uncultured Pseudoteredinibacter sp.]
MVFSIQCLEAAAQFNLLEEEYDCMLEPSLISDIGSPVPGVLDKITVDRGQAVSKGQVIAKLESSVEQKAMLLKRFQANSKTSMNLHQLMSEFGQRTDQRNSVLASTSAISEQDLDQIRTDSKIAEFRLKQEKENYQLAQLEYDQAKAIVGRKTILSPIDGVVMERYKSVGEFVDENPIVRVAQLNPLHVQAILPVELMGRLEIGQLASVGLSVDAYQPNYEAQISLVDKVADAPSSTFSVRLSLQNDELTIPAGVRCRIKFSSTVDPETYIAVKDTEAAVSESLAKPDLTLANSSGSVSDGEISESSRKQLKERPTSSSISEKASDEPSELRLIKTDSRLKQSDPPLTCYRFGPFSNSRSLNETREELKEYGLEAKLKDHSVASQFMVLSTARNYRLADVGELKSQGLNDMFLIAKGDNSGRISFGLYSKKSAAKSRLSELTVGKVEAEIVERFKAENFLESRAKSETQNSWLSVIAKNSAVSVSPCAL